MGTRTKLGLALGAAVVVAALLARSRGASDVTAVSPSDVRDSEEGLEREAPPSERQALDAGTESLHASELAVSEEPGGEPLSAVPAEGPMQPGPPGELEVLVLRGDRPVSGGTLYFTRSERNPWLPREPWTTDGIEQRPIGSDGIARARGLAAGRYALGIEVDRGLVHQRRVELSADEGRRVVVVLGTARLSGHVYDAEGRPIGNSRVQVDPVGGGFVTVTWTDADGQYGFQSLEAGEHWISARSGESFYDESLGMLTVSLVEQETTTFDFGRADGVPRWSGILQNRAGETVGPGTLEFRRVGARDYKRGDFDARGRFDVALEPGIYGVHATVSGRSRAVRVHAGVSVPAEGLGMDLVLPGTRVQGSVLRGGAPLPPEACANLAVSIHPRGETYPAAFLRTEVRPDATFGFEGIDPKEWVFATWPLELEAPIELLVQEDDLSLRVDLHVP